ncbi:hypothetical protein ACH4VR_36085 [Streptomyces sp. NPDC020883]|uniref:hypothetical protein n=1 Tax=Streptomyces sp. NPDC020883 TaxID=3365099 RepID=UPI0037927FEE
MNNEPPTTNRPAPTQPPPSPLPMLAALAALAVFWFNSIIDMVINGAIGRHHYPPAQYALTAYPVAAYVAVWVGARVWKAADRNARFLDHQFGPDTAALLDTRGKRTLAVKVFGLIARHDGDVVARLWMRDRNPQLNDENPLLAICGGHGANVLKAARRYANAENAN